MRTPVVVHLVHGTWPYGLLGLGGKSWFDDGSNFRTSISEGCGDNLEFRVCRWSGRNSVKERKKASFILYSQIIEAIEEYPEARQIIVAHSHGGTVAADALSYEFEPTHLSRISAFVAMATPFAYTRSISNQAAALNGFCLATVLTTVFFLLINQFVFDLPTGFVMFVVWLLCNFFMIFLVGICSYSSEDQAYMGEPIDPKVPIFLIRATRDEAALSLALAEAFNGINLFIAQHLAARRGWKAALALGAAYATISRYVLHGNPLPVPEESGDDIGAFLIAYIAIPCAFAMLGKAFQAIVTGMPLRLWRNYRIEVDVAPPNTDCVFRSYSDFRCSTRPPMRHAIYNLELVQSDVRHLITCAMDARSMALRAVNARVY